MALVWMKPRRASTSSPMSVEKISSAIARSPRRDLQQRAGRGVHGRLAQLVPVHLAEPLEPADLDLAARVRGLERGERGVVLQVRPLVLAQLGPVQRRLGDVDMAGLHDLGHLAVEERQQQRADVRSVDVGVTHR